MVLYQWTIITKTGIKGIKDEPCLKSAKGGKLVDSPRDCGDGEGSLCSWNEPCTPCSPNYASVDPEPCAECRENTARLCGRARDCVWLSRWPPVAPPERSLCVFVWLTF